MHNAKVKMHAACGSGIECDDGICKPHKG